MGTILIDNLAAGMIVAHDVCDRSGRLLLGAGVELNDKYLRMLRAWGIMEVPIAEQQEGAPNCDEIVSQQLQAREAELRPLFRNVNLAHPAMGELFRLCLLRKPTHETR